MHIVDLRAPSLFLDLIIKLLRFKLRVLLFISDCIVDPYSLGDPLRNLGLNKLTVNVAVAMVADDLGVDELKE